MKKQQPIAIQLTNVSKKYEIHHEKPTLVEKFVKGKNETFWALQNIHATIRQGERVGVIGLNGSGKTTLLKIVAGITSPTTGTIQTHGRVVSLIDLEAGFHPDLSGIDNIYLNGMLLGMSRSEIDNITSSIISFADIHQFIDAPLYTYSSGMMLRLGFAIAISSQPDILIVDEMIAVGDMNFKRKTLNAIDALRATLLIATHDLHLIHYLCERSLNLRHGKLETQAYTNAIRRIRNLPLNADYQAVVGSQSMTGAINNEDSITVKKIPFTRVRRGDIIAFVFPSLSFPIIHRVAEITTAGNKKLCITKGDANIGFDSWKVSRSEYLGVVYKVNNKSL